MATIALVHASRASVDPVTQHYNQAAPQLRTVNMLDDAVMAMLAELDLGRAVRRLSEMVELARIEYKIPILKIDEPMTRRAAAAGRRIGIVATFPATVATTVELLHAAALAPIQTTHVLAAEALQALLRGDTEAHDRLLLEAAARVETEGIDALVLAQVSMARLEPQVRAHSKVPVFSSLTTSLDEVLALLAQTGQ
jgi:Asp/Glu/hydantoin racemase